MRTALETKVVEGVCNQRADVGSCVQPIIESSILITRVRYMPGDIHGGGPRHQHSIVVGKTLPEKWTAGLNLARGTPVSPLTVPLS